MIYPVIPEHKKPIIAVENSRYIVARFVEVAAHRFVVQRATNWETLEPIAQLLLEEEVGAAADDHYPCPDILAARATWPDE